MRRSVTAAKLERFMAELAVRAESAGNVYFTGGATALLLGMREQTIDVHVKFEPEPRGVFEALAKLKDSLDINVELASPADFIPVAEDWKERSIFIRKLGSVAFFHFDLLAQALSKIERGYEQDLADARFFLAATKVGGKGLWEYFLRTKPALLRYPAIDPEGFDRKVKMFLKME